MTNTSKTMIQMSQIKIGKIAVQTGHKVADKITDKKSKGICSLNKKRSNQANTKTTKKNRETKTSKQVMQKRFKRCLFGKNS